MKTYITQRPPDDDLGDCRVTVRTDTGQAYPLPHIVVHSPTGFEWGYGGSGPADLAVSILADYFGPLPHGSHDHRALDLHQPFKWRWIASAPHAGWTLTSAQIAEWLQTVEAQP